VSIPRQKIVFIVDAMAFRRARAESFLSPWARNEQVELISLDPDEAHARLAARGECDMLIYCVGAAPALEIFAEIQVLQTLCRDAALAIVSDHEDPTAVIAVMRSGAQGYFGNSMPPDLALQALSFVLHGGTYFPPAAIMACRALGGLPPTEAGLTDFVHRGQSVDDVERQNHPSAADQEKAHYERHERQGSLSRGKAAAISPDGDNADGPRPAPELTERQYAVLVCLCQGDPNKVIGRKLGMTETTVKVHVREIMRKLGVSNRTQVVIAARRSGVGTEDVGIVPSDAPIISKSSVHH
jgi:DNA-binding NarL/FixJ family response regulator